MNKHVLENRIDCCDTLAGSLGRLSGFADSVSGVGGRDYLLQRGRVPLKRVPSLRGELHGGTPCPALLVFANRDISGLGQC